MDYFFYALLRTQGEDTTDERSTASVVPLAEVPNIMRALGYYPTEQVRFSVTLRNECMSADVELRKLRARALH